MQSTAKYLLWVASKKREVLFYKVYSEDLNSLRALQDRFNGPDCSSVMVEISGEYSPVSGAASSAGRSEPNNHETAHEGTVPLDMRDDLLHICEGYASFKEGRDDSRLPDLSRLSKGFLRGEWESLAELLDLGAELYDMPRIGESGDLAAGLLMATYFAHSEDFREMEGVLGESKSQEIVAAALKSRNLDLAYAVLESSGAFKGGRVRAPVYSSLAVDYLETAEDLERVSEAIEFYQRELIDFAGASSA